MMTDIKYGPGPKIQGMPTSFDFSVSLSMQEVSYPEETQVLQRTFTRVTQTFEAYSTQENQVTVVSEIPVTLTPPEGFSLSGNILRKESPLAFTGPLRAESAYGSRQYPLLSSNGPARANTLKSVDTQITNTLSLYQEAYTQVASRLVSRTPGYDSQSRFLNGEVISIGTLNVTPNPGFAFADIDWSMVSIARTNATASSLPATLLSPRHAVFAMHVEVQVGEYLRFRRPDGSSQVVQVVARRDLIEPAPVNADIDVGLVAFDQDVTGCAFARLLPDYYPELLPDTRYGNPSAQIGASGVSAEMPVIVMAYNVGLEGSPAIINNQSPKAIVAHAVGLDSGRTRQVGVNPNYGTTTSPLGAYMRTFYGGDSSSPVFLLAREAGQSTPTPILLCALFTAGSGGDLAAVAPWLQAAMDSTSDELGAPRYQLLRADLSGYPRSQTSL